MTDKVMMIAELGINHNGSLVLAKKLIKEAHKAGCDAVKFQKRTIDLVYTKEELEKPRESIWGTTTRQQKEGLEFGTEQYEEIDQYCRKLGIDWFASAWDVESQKFLQKFDLKYNKVASAMLTHRELMVMIANEGKHTFISTGMSSEAQIEKVVRIFRDNDCPFELMHCNSTYPMEPKDANLRYMKVLGEKFSCNVGYSGHESCLIVSCAAVALGASSIERHITLDRASVGSDHAASLEIAGLRKLVAYVRAIEESFGRAEKIVTEFEQKIAQKLRKVDSL